MKKALPLAFAVAALAIFTLGSAQRGLWNPDEPREAAIAREVWRRGDPVVPYLNGAPFLEKPPLYAWLSGLAFRLRGGPDAVGARLTSSVAGAALVGLTVRLALSALAPAQAALAGAALAAMPLFWWHASRANLDVPLALFVGMAVAGFYRAWARRDPHHPALDLAAVATALAMLTKGLVGLALPVLIVAAFLLLERDLWFLARLRWPRLIALLLVPVLCWMVPFARRDGGALAHTMFVKHHLERYVGGFDHPGKWWHYLRALPLATLPWLVLALPGLIDRQTTSLHRLARAWLLAPLAFFTLSSTKRDLYMLPSFPAIALLVALGRARWAAALAGVVMLAVAGALGPFAPAVVAQALAVVHAQHAWVLPVIAASWALAGVALIVRGERAFAAVPGVLTAALALGWVLPAVDALKSARDLQPLLASSANLVGYQLREGDLGILTFGRDPIWMASHAEDLPLLLDEGKQIVGSEHVLMPALGSLRVRVVASAPCGSDRFVVVEREGAPTGSSKGRKVALTLRSMVH